MFPAAAGGAYGSAVALCARNCERPAVPLALTASTRPSASDQIANFCHSGATAAPRRGCWDGWGAARVRHAGKPKGSCPVSLADWT